METDNERNRERSKSAKQLSGRMIAKPSSQRQRSTSSSTMERSSPLLDKSIDIDEILQNGSGKIENRTKILINVFENSLYGDFRLPDQEMEKSNVVQNQTYLMPPEIDLLQDFQKPPIRKETPSNDQPGRSLSLPGIKADLSHLLSIKSFSNTVDLQVNGVKYNCSGAILASQSPVFLSQLSRGASLIVLEGLECQVGEESVVEECLLLLYGGAVVLSERNIPVMIRFSVQFQVENMYRLAMEWVRNCISVSNVYTLWLLGCEPAIAGKKKRKKNDLLYICRNFVRGREVEIAYQLREVRERGGEVKEEFVFLMLQYTDCASVISDLL